MKFKEKKNYLLNLLYEKRFDGKSYDVFELLESLKISIPEASEIARSLSKEGFVKIIETKDGIYLNINSLGIENIEEEELEEVNNFQNELFTNEEKNVIIKRLDELSSELNKIKKGQEIIYDDLVDEISELKPLLSILNKKNWKQILKGKLVDIGLGNLTEEVGEILVDIFKDQKFLQ